MRRSSRRIVCRGTDDHADDGAINGAVTDSTKAGMPGVTVRLSRASLMTTQTTLTDEAGAYRFAAVPPGDHTLTFERAGFGTVVREGIHVGIGFTATLNIDMSPSTVSHLVTVSGAAPVVDITSSAVTTHFDAEKLANVTAAVQPFVTSDALANNDFPMTVWKAEYNAAATDTLYVEARVGGYLSRGAVNLTTNLPDSNSEYYTWEITATKRQTARWAQALTTSSGGSWLRPTAITGPRILRIGARWDW